MRTDQIRALIDTWRSDSSGTYRTWFLWEQRLKNFRSIRRGISIFVEQVEADSFGNSYKGSSLETVIGSIAEQRQIFRGADHAFLWKPKLRIPDIYENRENQLSFARFLDACACCNKEEQLIAAIRRLDERRIKGLGPAVANLLYFLHPTLVLPFNTAIVKGFNALMQSNVRLGRWDEYLAMLSGAKRLCGEHLKLLSNDLGAVAGFLFDVGMERYPLPLREDDMAAEDAWRADLARERESSAQQRKAIEAGREGDRTHTEVQGWLRDLGFSLGFHVWVASNDRSRTLGGGRLGDGCLDALPAALASVDSVSLIDVIWIEPRGEHAAAAFEVEHTTSIHSGIMRMLDLVSVPTQIVRGLYLVAPDARENEVRRQLSRPAFRHIGEGAVKYLPYSALEQHRESMGRFGEGLKAVDAVARSLRI